MEFDVVAREDVARALGDVFVSKRRDFTKSSTEHRMSEIRVRFLEVGYRISE